MQRKTLTFLTIASVLSLSIVASGCSKQPVRTVSSHPPASDLQCAAEPAALTDDQIMSDQFGDLERQFTIDAIMAGRDCRDALARVCQWHKDRGDKDIKDCTAPKEPLVPAASLVHAERG